jgi:hypothetical protein
MYFDQDSSFLKRKRQKNRPEDSQWEQDTKENQPIKEEGLRVLASNSSEAAKKGIKSVLL